MSPPTRTQNQIAQVVQKLAPSISRMDRRFGEDLVGEVQLACLQRVGCYDWERDDINRLVLRIARNRLADMRRKSRREAEVLTGYRKLVPSPSRLEQLEMPDFEDMLAEITRFLKPGEKEILVCRVIDGVPHERLAERFGISVGDVRVRWSRIRARLAANPVLRERLIG
ncbi:sigma-70 family RNA polymerase sigma factor [bacterium]|nr:sigma-70 family RNA polymerase sigma factor [bacterium]